MTRNVALLFSLVALFSIPCDTFADTQPTDVFDPAAKSLKAPSPESVKESVLSWLVAQPAEEPARAQAAALWDNLPEQIGATELLYRSAATFAIVDPRAHELWQLCAKPRQSLQAPEFAWLKDEKTSSPLVRNNLRLVYGRWLSRERYFDDSLAQLDGLEPWEVIDPAALLFFQGVGHHWLLHKEPGLKSLRRLVNDFDGGPKRYQSLASLMLADLEALEDDSLDHISRRMDDVERRLELGHAGPKVRGVEDGIIASLDKIIDKMEEEQKKKQGGGGGGGTIRSTSPARDSMPMGGKGPGETDRRNIGSESGWGDLPPKERQEALQQIGKDFPSHYRDAIEQYFRKLAGGEGEE